MWGVFVAVVVADADDGDKRGNFGVSFEAQNIRVKTRIRKGKGREFDLEL